uniref:Putative conserved plasma membrane protein n=1 Tax=Nyssomyia neivai TaxID=330878 RepID=A0A1L8D9L9_9DIPT
MAVNEERRRMFETFLQRKLNVLHGAVLGSGKVTEQELIEAYRQYQDDGEIRVPPPDTTERNHQRLIFGSAILIFILCATPLITIVLEMAITTRCLLPNNYLVWEATRPISDCDFCRHIQGPLIFGNLTKEEFRPYAYSSQPIILKNAISHWPATKLLNYTFLRDLYGKIPGALDSVQSDCQFLHFKSNFLTLRDVFSMSQSRAEFHKGEVPWYVGWSNCHPQILTELRKLYPRPHFLPDDAEMPNTDFIFLGYEQGAVMHLDYIPRLMWQAQLRGNKSWVLAPTPECDAQCKSFSFYVEPGDAVLVDTRLWYHGTYVPKGEFSLTIQSEYG